MFSVAPTAAIATVSWRVKLTKPDLRKSMIEKNSLVKIKGSTSINKDVEITEEGDLLFSDGVFKPYAFF